MADRKMSRGLRNHDNNNQLYLDTLSREETRFKSVNKIQNTVWLNS